MQFYKMQQNGYNYREGPMTSGIVYQHMSNHYRRILNAKPAVDTSVPQSFKPRLARSVKFRRRSSPAPFRGGTPPEFGGEAACSVEDLALLDRIVTSSDYSPTDICRLQYYSSKYRNNEVKRSNCFDHQQNNYSHPGIEIKMKGSGDVVAHHMKKFETNDSQFWPRILKTDVTSKLREMRIYHPPRRKSTPLWTKDSVDEAEQSCGCIKECHCETNIADIGKEASQASSRDSAYNGGTCSTPNSRSPTPCQQNTPSKHAATQTEPRLRKHSVSHKKHNKKTVSDDFAYIKFIHDITADAVRNGQYTDKSLSKVIRKHIDANSNTLDKKRMLEEVKKLREMLGMSGKYDDEEVSVDQKPFRKDSVYENDSLAPIESESWTVHYMQLSSKQSSKSVDKETDSVEIEENFEKVDNNTTISSEILTGLDVEESDSSRENTIKEVVHDGAESSSEEELDEVVEAGTSYDDDFFS